MTAWSITGARVVDPASGRDEVLDLHIADGCIAALGKPPVDFQPERIYAADGLVACPGLIDLAARTREPGQTRKANIASEARAAAAGGITTLICPPDTTPVTDTPSVVELIRNRSHAARGARVLPLGALTRGLTGEQLSEMVALHEAGCPGLSDGGHPVTDSLVLRRALEYAATFNLPVHLTPEEPVLADGLAHEGQLATRMGLPGVPVAAETAALGRMLALAEEIGARVHFGRLSSRRGLEQVIAAKRGGQPVSADAAIHQLFLTEMDIYGYQSQAHVRPPLRSTGDRDALRRALTAGDLSVICSDHRPHEPDAKNCPFAESEPGISGLDSLLALILRLADELNLPLTRALAPVTIGPARALDLPAGQLTEGAPADICLFDPDAVWWFGPDAMHSRGENSPFTGWEFTGRTHTTVVDGQLVYDQGR
ncbi:dihydroorotase [Alkalispirillum mobile]|uniref:Dihydroorotase n=1 Tax=Alkalispirillum mobile TaxID=85925 RepID=A0A498C6P9_9GAMM|nr:dihydroorotase [Alkalispirillum mobile]RLK51402.1 dihydroorotase [Alkalispirillum mobile]